MITQIIKTEYITELDKLQLYGLFKAYYDQTAFDSFIQHLSEKQWVIRMVDQGHIVGFSTQQLYPLQIDGKTIHILFSGDTIVKPEYWQKSHLAGAGGHLIQKLVRTIDTPLYWFLIAKGYRTYRFLPVFFNQFYPACNQENPELRLLLENIARSKFGNDYCSRTGIIGKPEQKKDRLCKTLADTPEHRNKNPHIAYFLKKNPTYAQGTELACITPLTQANFTPLSLRVLERTKVEWNV